MTILGAIGLDLDTVVANLFDTSSSTSIAGAVGRSGGNVAQVSSSAIKNIGANLGTLFVAFAGSVGTLGGSPFFNMMDAGTNQVAIGVGSDGSVTAYRGTNTVLFTTAPGVIVSGSYNHIEMAATISATVGTIQVWVNSALVINLTAQNTKNTSNTTVSQFKFNPMGAGSTNYCDIVWGDARIGDRRVECKMPNGAGNYAQFTPSTGSNWQNVDDVPANDDTDYNDTFTVGAIDSFTHTALSGSPTSIDAVIVQTRARNTLTGAGSVAPHLRSGGVDSAGTAVALNTGYQGMQTVYTTDPATGSAWANAAAVNAAEIGYKKAA